MCSKKTLAIAISLALQASYSLAEEAVTELDEMVVEEEAKPPVSTHYTSPSITITDIEVEGINATTVEDFIKYEPGLVVRRRYIGDPNGTLGIRGANMFQTARALVYADGLPLHYLLQTQYNGSPRWSLVAPDETQAVEVVYGPFSAEYSGNAMGGVVNIDTRLPTEREFHIEAGVFAQDFDHLGTDESYIGHREFLSIGDKFDDLSVYLFHNHLENESQPMTFRFDSPSTPTGSETPVTGAIPGLDNTGGSIINYADSGSEQVTTDLTKLKLGYEMGDWLARFTLAAETRKRETDPSNYLLDNNGDPFWSGEALYGGNAFTVRSSNFAVSENERQTVLVGAGLEGPLGASDWLLEADFSYFDILKDETFSSSKNPDDPTYTTAGRVREYDDTGWTTLDLKARTDRLLGRSDMNLVTGYHYDKYSLEINDYNSDNYINGVKTSRRSTTGGKTSTQAIFGQWGWDFTPQWDLALGARYERWRMLDGFYYTYSNNELNDFDDRTETGFSPKFSLGFTPEGPWKFRYSLAKAYRFPIVEELFQNEEKTDGTTIADADLKPEVGIHHNLMVEMEIPHGFLRMNIFHETVDDTIFNQTDVATNVRTFLPVDEVTTTGVEFIAQQERVFDSPLDLRFNLNYTDSEITNNSADPSVEGNDFPRMPHWRANMLATYNINQQWDTSAGVRYASDSYGSLDNSDDEDEVFGAQDSYLFLDLKANFRPTPESRIGIGVDNVTDETAFVHHPWPQRTYYVEASIDF